MACYPAHQMICTLVIKRMAMVSNNTQRPQDFPTSLLPHFPQTKSLFKLMHLVNTCQCLYLRLTVCDTHPHPNRQTDTAAKVKTAFVIPPATVDVCPHTHTHKQVQSRNCLQAN